MTIVRRAVEADREALASFILEAYGRLADYKNPQHWNWQFWSNPFRQPEQNTLPVAIAMDGEKIVGQIAVQPAQFRAGQEIIDGGWIVDVYVLATHRGRGLGHRLLHLLAEEFRVLLTLTMAPATRRMLARADGISLNETHRLSKIVSTTSDDVEAYILTRLQDRMTLLRLSRVTMRALKLHYPIAYTLQLMSSKTRRRLRHLPRQPLELVEVERFGADLDLMWDTYKIDYPAIAPRNSTFLNWRFAENPDLKYRLISARRNGACVGYTVLRLSEELELRSGIIVDLFAPRGDDTVISALIDFAERMFGQNLAFLECASSDQTVLSCLRAAGFRVTTTARPVAICKDAGLRRHMASHRNDWYFTKADHDWDQIHLANTR